MKKIKTLDDAVVFDTEIYVNYFLAAFKSVKTGKIVTFEKTDRDDGLDREGLARIMRMQLTVGFNSNNFDLLMVQMAIEGFSIEDIKRACDMIISEGMKHWDVARHFNVWVPERNSIDLIEVAPGQASLKIYNGRLHGKRMQDLPIELDTILSEREMADTKLYCINDLDATELLFKALRPQLDLRVAMSAEYEIDLRSKSDAQVAEAVIKKQLGKITGVEPRKPVFAPGQHFTYRVPEFVRFQQPELREMLQAVRKTLFKVHPGTGSPIMPKSLEALRLTIGDSTYQMGMGGLHSTESSVAHEADNDTLLIDRDVASYYPAIILNLGLYPRHLGRPFLSVYKSLVERRLAAKKAGDKIVADSLKITINGSFGKLGSRWSALYAPDLMIQVTLTGQLALLMLIERIEAAGIPVVSANTDGIVIKCPKDSVAELNGIIKCWEDDTRFETEETLYSAVYSRDVNSYLAVYADAKNPKELTKGKGAFAKPNLQINAPNQICLEALIANITADAPIAETVRNCRDITKFLTVRTVKGGAVKDGEYLGKAIRWVYAKGENGCIHYKSNGYTVARTEGARPMMQLPDKFPDYIDYDWYIMECIEMMRDCGILRKPLRITQKNRKFMQAAIALSA